MLQCQPVSAAWMLRHEDDAKCLNFFSVAIGSGIFNVLSELTIFLLPIPLLLRLQIQLRQKIKITILLGLGFM